jgi:glycosyltransferase involved in cell wall biosynthesis
VRGQDYQDREHIIIDGQSTDGTVEIIAKYGQSGDLAYWVSEPDGGIYEAMNKGIAKATGDVVTLLSSNDYYLKPDCLRRVADYFRANPTSDIVSAQMALIDENGFFIGNAEKRELEEIHYRMVCNHPATFVKRGLFGQVGFFDTRYRIAADYDWLLRAYHRGFCFMNIDEALVAFHMDGVSTTEWRQTADEVYMISTTANPPAALAQYRSDIDGYYQAKIRWYSAGEQKKEFVKSKYGELREGILRLTGKGTEIGIFGFGAWGRECFALLKQLDIDCRLIIDNDEKKWQANDAAKVGPIDLLEGFCGTVIIAVDGGEAAITQQIEARFAMIGFVLVSFRQIRDMMESLATGQGKGGET